MTQATENPDGNTLLTVSYALLLVALAFNDFFQYSGYAYQLNWSFVICHVVWLLFLGYVLVTQKNYFRLIVITLWVIFAGHMFFYPMPIDEQLVTVTPLLTVCTLTLLFSRIFTWTPKRLSLGGIFLMFYVLIMLFFLLPGHLFSGWNPNSPIILIPSLIFGIATAFVFGNGKIKFLTAGLTVISLSLIISLENRSSTLCVFLFVLGNWFSIYKWPSIFRITYILLISANLLFPFFWEYLPFYDSLSMMSGDVFAKSSVLNGRQNLWPGVIARLQMGDLFWGTGGKRMIYSHNLSLDILGCAGIAGYCLYIASVIFLLEKGFKTGSKNNIFLYGFLALFILNTFENVMICNNTYMIFQFMLLAIPISLKLAEKNAE